MNDHEDAVSLMEAVRVATREVHAKWLTTYLFSIIVIIVYTVCLTRYLENSVNALADRVDNRLAQLSNAISIGNQTVTVERQKTQADLIEDEMKRRRKERESKGTFE